MKRTSIPDITLCEWNYSGSLSLYSYTEEEKYTVIIGLHSYQQWSDSDSIRACNKGETI